MGECQNCIFWTPPSQREDFHDTVEIDHKSADWDTVWARQVEADKMFGQCREITLGGGREFDVDDELPLAVTKDGSDYKANLYTQATFGCVLFEDKE